MPDALIVYDNVNSQWQESDYVIEKMVKIVLIKCVSIKGVKVYGRHYLTNRAIREAYQKQCKSNT